MAKAVSGRVMYDDAGGGGDATLLPSQFWAALADPRSEPTKRLMVAVLEEAIAVVVNRSGRGSDDHRAWCAKPSVDWAATTAARRSPSPPLRHPGTGREPGASDGGRLAGRQRLFTRPPPAGRPRSPPRPQRRRAARAAPPDGLGAARSQARWAAAVHCRPSAVPAQSRLEFTVR
jgi:hypothetical protein